MKHNRHNPRQATTSEQRAIANYLARGGNDNWSDGSYLTWRGNFLTGRWLERSHGGTIREWVV